MSKSFAPGSADNPDMEVPAQSTSTLSGSGIFLQKVADLKDGLSLRHMSPGTKSRTLLVRQFVKKIWMFQK